MKKYLKLIFEKIWYFYGSLIVSFLYFAVCFLKKIYPFGENSICYFDTNQVILPYYYHTHDFYHGLNDVFLNWFVGLGSSMAEQSGNFIFFPTNLFLLLSNRNSLYEFMTFFVVFKLFLAAFFMTVYAFYKSKNKMLSVMVSIIYCTSGFVLQYYETIFYLDWFIIFPILIYSYDRFVHENKKLLYIICLFLAFLCHPQMIFFTCVYLIIKTFFVIKEFDKNKKSLVIFNLFRCSICSFLCSCFCFLPVAIQTFKSARLSSSVHSDFVKAMDTIICEYQQQKNFMLYGVEFVVPLVLVLTIRKKINKYISNIVMIMLLALPILFEGSDLMWHMGSYKMFPLRFGFILTFECLNFLIASFEDIIQKEKTSKISYYLEILSIAIIPMFAMVLLSFVKPFGIFGIRDCQIYISYWLIVLLISVIYLGFFSDGFYITKFVAPLIVILIQASLGLFGFLGVEMYYSAECEPDIIFNSEAIKKETAELDSVFDRTKDANLYLNANYPFITRTSAVSGWTNGTSSDLIGELVRMGYDSFYIRSLDCGGTVLTDSLFGYKYIVNNLDNYNNDLYSDFEGKEHLLKYNFDVPYGAVISTSSKFVSNLKSFDYQNELYRFLTGEDDDLFYTISEDDFVYEEDEKNNKNKFICTFELKEPCILYVYGNPDFINSYVITVNGEEMKVPYLYNENNVLFPSYLRNGFLELGSFENEVKLGIIGEEVDFNDIDFGVVSLNDFSKAISIIRDKYDLLSFQSDNNSLKIEIDAKESGEYIIPIGYSDNWKVFVNGTESTIKKEINGSLLSINVNKGHNEIELKFRQKGFIPGIIASIFGFILIFVNLYINPSEEKKRYQVFLYLYYFVLVCVIVYLYIDPISLNIYKMINSNTTIFDIISFYF